MPTPKRTSGLMTKYDEPWVGAAQSLSFDVKTYNINPSVAFRLNERVSLGFGVSWQRLEAEYKRRAATVAAPALDLTQIKLTLDDDAWGWNAGILIDLSPATRVGLSYRSTVKYDATGKITASGDATGVATVNALGRTGNAKASIELPDSFIASFTHQMNDRWTLLGDLSWTGWSSIPKIDVMNTTTNALAQSLNTQFQDTWRLALGGTYKMSDAMRVKMGFAYDQTPVKGATTRLVSLPDNDRIWLSAGAQWTLAPASTLDVGVAYLSIQDAKIDNNQLADGRGRVTGTYKDSGWILGVQYSSRF